MNGTIIPVPFHGDTIDAIKPAYGTWRVSLRRMCENLGVDYGNQLKKLKEKPWATVVIMTTVGADGKTRDMVMVDRKTLTMWLAGINATKVKPELRGKVDAYQCEAADALDQYFNEGGAIRTQPGDSDADIMARALLIAQRTLSAKDRQLSQQRERLAVAEPKARMLDDLTNTDGLISVGDAAKLLSNRTTMKIGRNDLFALLREWGWIYREDGHWTPPQRHVHAGHLVLKDHDTLGTRRDGTRFAYAPKVMLTRPGMMLLMRKWAQRQLDQPELEASA